MQSLEKRIKKENDSLKKQADREKESFSFGSVKSYIENKIKEKRREASFQKVCRESLNDYLSQDSISKIGSIEVGQTSDGSDRVVVYTEFGPIIKTSKEVYDENGLTTTETYEGFAAETDIDAYVPYLYSKINKTVCFAIEDECSYDRVVTYSGISRNQNGQFKYIEEVEEENERFVLPIGEASSKYNALETRFEKYMQLYSDRFTRVEDFILDN